MPTATASNAPEHSSGDKCVAALPLATEHTGRGVQGGVLSVDDALHRVGYGDFARNPPSKAPYVPESQCRWRLAAVKLLAKAGVRGDEIAEMNRDGRLGGLERMLESGQTQSRLTPSLSRIRKASFRHVYVLEVLDVGTKVGMTRDPDQRLSAHAIAAKQWKREIGRTWVSVLHAEALANERVLVGLEPGRSEFLAMPFGDVVERALQLRMTTLRELFRW